MSLPKSETTVLSKPALYVVVAITYPLVRICWHVALWVLQLLWPYRLPIFATVAFVEAAFYLLWFLPRYHELNQTPRARRKVPSGKDSARAFQKFIDVAKALPDAVNVDEYLSIWFRNAPYSDIKRGNVEEFLCYGFWYRTREQMEAEGLAGLIPDLVTRMEDALDIKFPPGYTPGVKFLDHLWDELHVHYRPLGFYLATEVLGLITRVVLASYGFTRKEHGGMIYYTYYPRGKLLSRSSSSSSLSSSSSSRASHHGGSPSPSPRPSRRSSSSGLTTPPPAAAAEEEAATSGGGGGFGAFVPRGWEWPVQLPPPPAAAAGELGGVGKATPAPPAAAGGSTWAVPPPQTTAAAAPPTPSAAADEGGLAGASSMGSENPLDDVLGSGTQEMPILFLHGVGGLVFYVEMIRYILATGHPVIVVEYKHVGMRLCSHIPSVDEVTSQVISVLDAEGAGKVCVMGHSYGSFVASRIAQLHKKRLHTLWVVDPVCFAMFMPYLLYNFIYRRPRLQLQRPLVLLCDLVLFFASRELHIAATFCRSFYWTDLNLWPEDMPPGSVVILSGNDELCPEAEVRQMLEMCGHIKVLSNPHLFHGAFLLDHTVKEVIMGEVKVLLSHAATLVNDIHGAVEDVVSEVVRPILHRTFTLPSGYRGRPHSYIAATTSYHEPLQSEPWLEELSELRPSRGGLERRSTFLGSMIIRRSYGRRGSGSDDMCDVVSASWSGDSCRDPSRLGSAIERPVTNSNLGTSWDPSKKGAAGSSRSASKELTGSAMHSDDEGGECSSDGDLGGWQKVDVHAFAANDTSHVALTPKVTRAADAIKSDQQQEERQPQQEGPYLPPRPPQQQQQQQQQEQQQLPTRQARRKQLLQAVMQGWNAGRRRSLSHNTSPSPSSSSAAGAAAVAARANDGDA